VGYLLGGKGVGLGSRRVRMGVRSRGLFCLSSEGDETIVLRMDNGIFAVKVG
jgi:hypothetical protein